jgi:hypothetical protein
MVCVFQINNTWNNDNYDYICIYVTGGSKQTQEMHVAAVALYDAYVKEGN